MDIWWKKHPKRATVNSERIILFNRYLERGLNLEKSAQMVNWSFYTAHQIKELIWGDRTPQEIFNFCAENRLIHRDD